jgi:hypothetical protein
MIYRGDQARLGSSSNICLRVSLAAFLTLAVASPASAQHCYSIWKFHEPQRCGGNNRPPVVRIAKRETVPVLYPPTPGPSFDLPLPDADPAMTVLKERLQ